MNETFSNFRIFRDRVAKYFFPFSENFAGKHLGGTHIKAKVCYICKLLT